jgi:single-strand selective monofunctional uracil DNA glycosylase
MDLLEVTDRLNGRLGKLSFSHPVTHVYNPHEYARMPYNIYIERYGRAPKRYLFLGMNPGPWGMVQTGIPFGDVQTVSTWLDIRAGVNRPARVHPKRPVEGFSCRRREISGKRLWGWAQHHFVTPDVFFQTALLSISALLPFLRKTGKIGPPT